MRKMLIGVFTATITVVTIVVGAGATDFGISIYAENRLSASVRKAANLGADPFVAIVAFPFVPQAMRHRYNQVEIKANGVAHATVGQATLEATMYSVDLAYSSWLINPNAKLPVGTLESRIIIDSMHLGRYMGISDLMVEAPRPVTNTSTGGTTASGISGSHGLVLSGTPKSAGLDYRVTVLVDVAMSPDNQTTLTITPTGFTKANDTVSEPVPDDKRDAVLRAFSTHVADQKLPFAVAPTTVGARGSDVIIEGVTTGVTIALDGFKQS
jgi:LmeA-like phospholipid-binding